MIRTFRIGSVEKNDYTQTMRLEMLSPRSLHLSYEIDALRSRIYTAQMGI
jgi:hypothetical protein